MEELGFILATAIGMVALVKGVFVGAKNRRGGRGSRGADHAATPTASASASVTETGPMIYYANDRHGMRDKEYRFNYKRVYDSSAEQHTWRAYILRMPDLRGRDPGLHETHRFTDGGGNYWVCWDTPVATLKDMQTISRVWADSVQEYIATGKRFG